MLRQFKAVYMRLSFTPKFSLTPNRLVLYNEVEDLDYPKFNPDGSKRKAVSWKKSLENVPGQNRVKRSFHNWQISHAAQKNLRKKIDWMYYLSKSKCRTTYNGKKIYNFRMCFLTLTLPSKQIHPTEYVTTKLLNQFLTELRQRAGMINYVWRLEFQNNGNVHYHLVTDSYLDYYFVLPIWNRILANYGYIYSYARKHRELNLSSYRAMYDREGKQDFETIAKRYANGKKTAWTQPNSVDVKSVLGSKNIAGYISKYFAKYEKSGTIKNDLDTQENSEGMRLWFCSRSLSRMKNISEYMESIEGIVADVIKTSSGLKKIILRYATVIYFDLNKFQNEGKKIVANMLNTYAHMQGYVPVT